MSSLCGATQKQIEYAENQRKEIVLANVWWLLQDGDSDATEAEILRAYRAMVIAQHAEWIANGGGL